MDPSFWIIENATPVETYPWDGLTITADTAFVLVPAVAPESGAIMSFYGHYHLMKKMGRLDEFLPEAVDAEGYALERAILTRVADAWLYGRALFDMTPYGPLDEIMYAREHGFLEALILTARPDEFADERSAWLDANPGRQEEYRGVVPGDLREGASRPPLATARRGFPATVGASAAARAAAQKAPTWR